MGGNALTTDSVRLTREDYFPLREDCLKRLQAAFPGRRIRDVLAYRNKADFGDLDILIESVGYDPLKAAEALRATEVVRNGPVTSVGLLVTTGRGVPARPGSAEVFQVDLIRMEPDAYEFAYRYFAYNDLGNLIGRVAHKMGLRFGHDGLALPMRDGDNLFHTVKLTQDFDQALNFLAYDTRGHRKGFDDLEAIFKYAASTPFFNPEIFALENRSYAARVRDRKRKTYTEFLAWIADRPELPAYAYPADKKAWLPEIFSAFPAAEGEYQAAQARLNDNKLVKARFNGNVVREWTGLEGKALGALMTNVRASFPDEGALNAFMLNAGEDAIRARVRAVLDVSAVPGQAERHDGQRLR